MPRGSSAELEVGELLSNLKVFVTSANWFKYGQNENCAADSSTLVAYEGLFQSLSALSPNLSFKKSTVSAVFKQLAVESQFPKLNSDFLLHQWADVMTARLRMACRHVARARTHKPSPPDWVQHIDGPMTAAGELASQAARHSELYITLIIRKLMIILLVIVIPAAVMTLLVIIRLTTTTTINTNSHNHSHSHSRNNTNCNGTCECRCHCDCR